MNIGPYKLKTNLVLAPMAGVTDRPFRMLCKEMGAGLVVSEMLTADVRLWRSNKSRLRMDHDGESEPRSIQIAGADPDMLAAAARLNVDRGAQIIDINMGCPAKKVCNVQAGSALLRDEKKVADILEAVVGAVDVPVTLKIRTGWDPANRNGVEVARIAEDAGIQALAVHGRTRACRFGGEAEFDTVRRIKAAVSIPVIANGDIDSPVKAKQVLAQTGADGVMIGRGAQGRPWLFREIEFYLRTGQCLAPPTIVEERNIMMQHLRNLHRFYGEYTGVRIARKHIAWYLKNRPGSEAVRGKINQIDRAEDQLRKLGSYFNRLADDAGLAA